MMPSFSLAGYPAIRILSVMLGGAVVGYTYLDTFPQQSITSVYAILWTIFLIACYLEFSKKVLDPKWVLIYRRYSYLLVLLFVAMTFGLEYQQNNQQSQNLVKKWDGLKWKEITFSGTVEKVQDDLKGRYVVRFDSMMMGHSMIKNPKTKALIYISKNELMSTGFNTIAKGDKISAVAKILPVLSGKERKENDFDKLKWLLQLEVQISLSVQTLYDHKKSQNKALINRVRVLVSQNISHFFGKSSDLAALAHAMVLADKTLLTDETRDLYQKTGLSHVLAVSGFHVSMVLLPLWWFMPRFWLNNRRKWVYLLLATTLMLFYVMLTDSPASVQRATIMAWFLLVGKLWHFNGPPINMLAFAALIMLVAKPATIFDVGFQLSFAAVSAIFLVFQPLEKLFPYNFRTSRTYKWLISSLLFTFILQAAMFPITAYYFGEHAHLGPVANLVYLPFLSFIMFPLFIVAALLTPLFPELVLNIVVGFLAKGYLYLEQFLQWLCHFPIATQTVSPPSLILLIAFFCMIISLNFWTQPRIRWRTLCIALICLNLDTIIFN